jgi:hypothetical protein
MPAFASIKGFRALDKTHYLRSDLYYQVILPENPRNLRTRLPHKPATIINYGSNPSGRSFDAADIQFRSRPATKRMRQARAAKDQM